MYSPEPVKYVAGAFDFLAPEDFHAPHPLRYGFQRTEDRAVLYDAPQALLVYILSGVGEMTSLEGDGAYDAHCVIFTARASSLILSPECPTEYRYLLLENAMPFPAPLPKQVVHPLAPDNPFGRMMERICRNGKNGLSGSLYDASVDVFRLVMKLCELCAQESGVYSRLVQDAVNCVREEYAFLTGVEDLAERMGVTKSHLIRVFSAEVGATPGKFLQDVRLENAMLLLHRREYTLDMVAGLCGFSGANYFCKVFRRALGMSPGEYREGVGEFPPDLENRRRLLEMERRQLF